MKHTLHIGDCVKVLSQLEAKSVDCVITSPPYWGLRFYGKNAEMDWPDGWHGQLGLEPDFNTYVDHIAQVFREIKRVLKDKGSLWLNMGDTYAGGWGAEGKPEDWEDLHTRHKEKYPTHSVTKHASLPAKCLIEIPSRVVLRLIDNEGWILRNRVVWYKRNCLSAYTRVFARVNGKPIRAALRDILRLDGEKELPSYDTEGRFLWTRITWSLAGRNPARKLFFEDGTSETITHEHEVPVRNNGPEPILKRIRDLNIGDMLLDYSAFKIEGDIDSIYDEEAGYLIGVYLAEGNKLSDREGFQMAFHSEKDEAMIRRVEAVISGRFGEQPYRFQKEGKSLRLAVSSGVVGAIMDKFVAGSTSHNKHLTRDALLYGHHFLNGVLHGFLDGDGYWEQQNKRWRISITVNEALASDLAFIAHLSKWRVRRYRQTARIGEKTYPIIRIELRPKHPTPPIHGDIRTKKLVRIEETTPIDNFDIEVDNPSHLFVLDSGLVVHNHMPSSVKDRLANSHEYIFHLVKQQRYYYDLDSIREPHQSANGNKRFNIRVRDAQRGRLEQKWGDQYAATEGEVSSYNEAEYGGKFAEVTPETAEQFNSPRARTQRQASIQEKIGDAHQGKSTAGLYDPERLSFYHEKGKNPGDVIQPYNDKMPHGEDNPNLDSRGLSNARSYLAEKRALGLPEGNPSGKNPGDVITGHKMAQVPGPHIRHSLSLMPGHHGDYGHPSGGNPGDVIVTEDPWVPVLKARADAGGGAQREAYEVYLKWKTEHSEGTYEDFYQEVSSQKLSKNQDMKWQTGIDNKQTAWGNYASYLHLPNPKGKAPRDIVESDAKYSEAISDERLQLPTGSWPGKAQGWYKVGVPRTTHPSGKAPEDTVQSDTLQPGDIVQRDGVEYVVTWRHNTPRRDQRISEDHTTVGHEMNDNTGLRLLRVDGKTPDDFWDITTKPFPEAHFATFPEDICIRPIRATCPPNGTVLDPFAGSGTVAKVARDLGRNSISIELVPEYEKLWHLRLGTATKAFDVEYEVVK